VLGRSYSQPGQQGIAGRVRLCPGPEPGQPRGHSVIDGEHPDYLRNAAACACRGCEGGTWRVVPDMAGQPGPVSLPRLVGAVSEQGPPEAGPPPRRGDHEPAIGGRGVLLVRQPEKVAADRLARLIVSQPGLPRRGVVTRAHLPAKAS
jgi:hypothetical protein